MSKEEFSQEDLIMSQMGYDMEEAFLQVLQKYGETTNTLVAVGALDMATGHILQTMDKALGYETKFTDLFNEMRETAYKHFKENPTDTADYPNIQMPIGNC